MVSSSEKGDNVATKIASILRWISSGARLGESTRTTITSVVFSDTPYRRMASVIYNHVSLLIYGIQKFVTHVMSRIKDIKNLGMHCPCSQSAL